MTDQKSSSAMSKFFDSNILLYLVEFSDPRRKEAKKLVQIGGIISVQVLNEFADVARRKFKMSIEEISDVLKAVRESCDVVSLTLPTHERALEIASSFNVGIYDANIVAAAELAGCDVLYTEDLNNGQRFGSVTIVNPFI